jgi:hypothetical protein
MAIYEITPAGNVTTERARAFELVCFGLLVANAVFLAAFFAYGLWIVAPDGSREITDFVTIWGAGHLALGGHAAAAYDWPTLKLVDQNTIGHAFNGYLGWPYPPTFLLVAALLALLPYTVSCVAWLASTFLLYLVTIRGIIGDRTGYYLAAAFPAILPNTMVGQNGFLTTALIGGALMLLETQPLLAGTLIGLLSFKPHLGLLFPVALVAGGYWRAFASAVVAAAAVAALSCAIFGVASWQAFFAGVDHTLSAEGFADWGKLQTVFGLVHVLGGGNRVAWFAQLVLILAAATSVAAIWRSDEPYAVKAAALGTAVLLATSHVLIYDLMILSVPIAYLFRLGRERGFLAHEISGIGAACLLVVSFPFVNAPVGFAATLIVAALIARRALSRQAVAA